MICKTATRDILVVLNAGCALESLTRLLRKPLSGSHLKSNESTWGRSLVISIWFSPSLGDSTGIRAENHCVAPSNLGICTGRLPTDNRASPRARPKGTEPSSSLPATGLGWPMLYAEPRGPSKNGPDHTSFLCRVLLNWVENDALD